MCESLDFYFYAPPLAHNWNPYFGQLGGTYSNDNNTRDFFQKKIQNLCLNSCSECVLSKIFKPPLKVPYRSKVIVETVTKGHFSTHFLSDYGL